VVTSDKALIAIPENSKSIETIFRTFNPHRIGGNQIDRMIQNRVIQTKHKVNSLSIERSNANTHAIGTQFSRAAKSFAEATQIDYKLTLFFGRAAKIFGLPAKENQIFCFLFSSAAKILEFTSNKFPVFRALNTPPGGGD
jgi:hypothetical protein